jgi:3'-phosphoadenosine 5'-phosphosulfate sulfotransferase (PAPS reductase)/FAD synthetase
VKTNLQVCFSGGRTSAFMCRWLLDNKSQDYNFLFTFANTGLEHEDTLRFADAVDKNFGLGLVWLEAVVHSGRRASTYRIVNYETASRQGEPFEEVVAKYGLPNHSFKHCTRELKANPMKFYARSIWGDDFDIAIGIRADEKRRVSPNATTHHIVYPLVDMIPTTKADVLDYFEQFDWDLKIPEHYGNCKTCFKKSDKKLNMVYRNTPKEYDFFIHLDDLYSTVGPNTVPGPRKMFRGYRSTRELLSQFAFLNCDTSRMINDEDSGMCSESCEVFETVIPEAA